MKEQRPYDKKWLEREVVRTFELQNNHLESELLASNYLAMQRLHQALYGSPYVFWSR